MSVMEHSMFIAYIIIISIPFVGTWILITTEVLNEKIKRNIFLLSTVLFIFAQININYIKIYTSLSNSSLLHSLYIEFITLVIQMSLLSCTLYVVGVKGILRIVSAVGIAYFFVSDFFLAIAEVLGVLFQISPPIGFQWTEISASTGIHMLTLCLSLQVVWFLRKIQFGYKMKPFFTNRMMMLVALAVIFGINVIFRFATATGWVEDSYVAISFEIVFVIAVFLLLLYYTIIEANNQKIATQNLIILQTECNVKGLEKIQRDFRMLRHDFKNMLSSIYLQAMDGDIVAMEHFVSDTKKRFDRIVEMKLDNIDVEKVIEDPLQSRHILDNIRVYLRKVYQNPKSRQVCMLMIVLVILASYSIYRIYPMWDSRLLLFYLGGTMAVLFLVITLTILKVKKEKLISQEILVEAQQIYKENLLATQSDIISISNNYKEILSQLSLNVRDGRLEEIKRVVVDATFTMNNRLEHELRKVEQLGNIEIIEIRSLLLMKIIGMIKRDIPFNLEVVQPLTNLGMEIEDFNRCFGILLDNAIEACLDIDTCYIDILMIDEQHCFNIIVKNSTQPTHPVQEIYKEGVSTKGSNRGLGLASYRRILAKYDNINTRTENRDGVFTQELRIGVEL